MAACESFEEVVVVEAAEDAAGFQAGAFCFRRSALAGHKAGCTGTSVIDSTVLRVCHVKKDSKHCVLGIASEIHVILGWFFGFKLHLLINEMGELLAFRLTLATWMTARR